MTASCETYTTETGFVSGPPAPIKISRLPNLEAVPRRGQFLVFDGADGCGKGSMIQVVEAALQTATPKIFPHLTKHPGGTPLGNEIRKIMFETVGTKNMDSNALELLFLADHVEKCRHIDWTLKSGQWVISDRWYTTSNPAYSYIRGVNPEVTAFHDRMFDYVPYDTLFLLYGDPAVLLKRAQDRQVELHQAAKKWNTVEKAHEISKKFMDKFGQDPRTVLVPADTPLTSFERFDRYVGPAIIEQSKGTLRFDRNAIVRRLREQYPEGQGSLY